MMFKCWGHVLMLIAGCSVWTAMAEEPEQLLPGQVLRGQFVQERRMEGFSAPLKTSGDFILAPEQGLIWQARQPFAVTTVMTAKGISQQNGSVEMLNLPSNKAPFLAQLYNILGGALAGDTRMLEMHFDVVQSKDANGWHLALTPRPEAGANLAIRDILIDGTRFADHVVIHKVTGDRDELTFTGQSLNNDPLSAAEIDLLARVGQQ
jgi:Outer membrane lipoprotein carrier protein LolA-like